MKSYIIVLLFFYCNIFAQTTKKDFKVTKLEKEGEIGALLIKASRQNDLDSIIYFAKKALKLSTYKQDYGLQAHAFYRLGTAYVYKEDLDKSYSNINKCLAIAHTHQLVNFLREGYRMLGVIAGEKEDFDQCIYNFKESLKYASDPQDIMSIKINIGVVYVNTNKKDLAYEILKEIVNYYKNYKGKELNKDFLSITYLNLSIVAPTGKERLESVNAAILASKDTKDYDLKMSLILRKGELLLSNNNYINAIAELKKSYKESIKWDYKITAISSLIALSKVNAKINSYPTAACYLDTVLNPKMSALKIGSKSAIIDSIAFIVYHKTKDYEKSFYHGKRYINFQDSIIKTETDNEYIAFGKKYQTELKIKENQILKKNVIIKELEIARGKIVRIFFILIIILACIVIFFIYTRNRLKSKTNLLLLEKNQTIEEQNKLLERANASKQKLFSIISHDLINPFNTLMGYSKLLKEDFEILDEEQKKSYLRIIDRSATNNYVLVKNLLDWSRSQQQSIIVNKVVFNAYTLIEESVLAYETIALKKSITMYLPDNIGIEGYGDIHLLKTCIGNLVSNALKYTEKGGCLRIDTYLQDNYFCVSIADTGIGMTAAFKNSLFDLLNAVSSLGTEKEKGTGLGLVICKEFIEIQGGILVVNSELKIGTTCIVKLPQIDF